MIVDCHTHVFPDDVRKSRSHYVARDCCFAELYCDARAKMASADELVEAMDAGGVDVSVACGFGWADQGLCRETNDYIAEAVKRYPDRLIGFMSVQPMAGDSAVAEIERAVQLGLRGVGELRPDAQGCDLDDWHIMGPIVAAAQHYQLPLMVHASEPVGHVYPGKGHTRPSALFRFAARCQDVDLVLAHWGGGLVFYELMPEVQTALQRVWYDMAASCFLYRPEMIKAVSLAAGLDKVLFGTDFPLVAPSRMITYVDSLALDAADRERIMCGNAARLLGLSAAIDSPVR